MGTSWHWYLLLLDYEKGESFHPYSDLSGASLGASFCLHTKVGWQPGTMLELFENKSRRSLSVLGG